MAIKTLNLKQLAKYSENIYEAVNKASKRAEQILKERNYEKQMLLESLNIEDDTAEVIIQTVEEREQEVHPIDMAIEELLDGKLNVEYEKEKPF